jgi:hypothetical protein
MRYIILLLSLTSASSYATDILHSDNAAGGHIVLTDLQCTSKTTKLIYSTAPKNKTLFGCYQVKGNVVQVEWQNGMKFTLPYNNFSPINYF